MTRGRPPKDRPRPIPFDDEDVATYRRKLGARLRRCREDRSWSLRDVAALAGVSLPTLAMIESGTGDPKAITLLRLANALGVSPGWLAFGG